MLALRPRPLPADRRTLLPLTAARRAAQPEDDNEEEEGMVRTEAHVPVGRVVDFRKCFFKQNWPAWSAPA
jgi:hypothetical protein